MEQPVIEFDHIQHENEKDTYIKQLEDRIKYLEQAPSYNLETYQKLTEAEETIRSMSKMVTVATNEYRALERVLKRENRALKRLIKVYL
jgi:hypothetical protein